MFPPGTLENKKAATFRFTAFSLILYFDLSYVKPNFSRSTIKVKVKSAKAVKVRRLHL
jgi:hypothetical protein